MEHCLPWKVHLFSQLLALALLVLGGSTGSEQAWQVQREYYSGRVRTSIPDSHLFLDSDFLLVRSIDPQAGIISEDMTLLERGGACRMLHRELLVSGSEFSISSDAGDDCASGVLGGPDWQWTYLGYSQRTADGLFLECDSTIDAGGIYRESRFTDGSGKVLVYIDESGSRLDDEQYALMLTRWAAMSDSISRI